MCVVWFGRHGFRVPGWWASEREMLAPWRWRWCNHGCCCLSHRKRRMYSTSTWNYWSMVVHGKSRRLSGVASHDLTPISNHTHPCTKRWHVQVWESAITSSLLAYLPKYRWLPSLSIRRTTSPALTGMHGAEKNRMQACETLPRDIGLIGLFSISFLMLFALSDFLQLNHKIKLS